MGAVKALAFWKPSADNERIIEENERVLELGRLRAAYEFRQRELEARYQEAAAALRSEYLSAVTELHGL
jgi:hypothetical protein